MFENITAHKARSAKPAASLTVSLLLHGCFVGVVLLGYLGAHEAAPGPAEPISVTFRAPPPPPPPPPPAKSAAKKPKPTPKPVAKPPMVQPREIPPEPPPEPEPPAAEESSPDEGVEGGVEGGVAGGVVGGVLGGPPPPPEPVKGPVEFDDRMTRPVKLSGPDPEYTDQATEHEIQGTVVVKCVVTTEGIVKQCRVLHSLPFMDKAVVDALLRRRYSPAMVQGKPIEVDFTFTIRLKLPE